MQQQCTNDSCPSKESCRLFMNNELKGARRYVKYQFQGDRCEFYIRFGK